MKQRWAAVTAIVSLALLAAAGSPTTPAAPAAAPLGTGFTYQGQIQSGGQPVTGSCDIGFRLYGQASGGAPVAGPISQTVSVAGGLFTTALDFGNGAFNGSARWLDLTVRCPAGS